MEGEMTLQFVINLNMHTAMYLVMSVALLLARR
jgi:hypothetical protein